MDVDAIIVVGVATIAIGALLYGAGRLWLRSSVGHNVQGSSPRVTRTGILLAVAFALLLFGGLAAAHFAPASHFGEFVSRPGGRFAYAISLGLISILVQRWLRSRGVHLFSDDEKRRGPDQ